MLIQYFPVLNHAVRECKDRLGIYPYISGHNFSCASVGSHSYMCRCFFLLPRRSAPCARPSWLPCRSARLLRRRGGAACGSDWLWRSGEKRLGQSSVMDAKCCRFSFLFSDVVSWRLCHLNVSRTRRRCLGPRAKLFTLGRR